MGMYCEMGKKPKGKGKGKPKPCYAAAVMLALGLASAPAYAQDRPPILGCAGTTCSLYFVSGGWSPGDKGVVIGGNLVEWLSGSFGVGLYGASLDGDATWLGAACFIPSLRDSFMCGPQTP